MTNKYLSKATIILLLLITAWLGVSYLFLLFSDKLIFLTSFAKGPVRGQIQYEEVYLPNGVQDKIYLIQSLKHKSDIVVLCLHGNKGTISEVTDQIATKYNVVAPSYPGYHLSSGKPSEVALYKTVDLSIEYLHKLGFKNKNIIIFGASLGANPALYAAKKYPNLNQVIIVGAFDSIKSMCKDRYSIFCIFSGGLFNNIELAKKTQAKIRQFHSVEDEVVNFRKGENLFNFIASKDKKFQAIQGSHKDFPALQMINTD